MEEDITPWHERLDIDRDGQDEFIFFSFDARRIIITRHDFQQPAGINISRTSRGADHRFSVFESPDQPPHLYFQSGENCYLFKYSGNPLYILKLLIPFGQVDFVISLNGMGGVSTAC